MSHEPLFSGTDIACVRGGRLIFSGVDFALAAGEALILTGPNGSGKSSLLRLMAGLMPLYKGRLLWQGADEHMLYLGHADAVKPALTVRETVLFWARLSGQALETDTALAALGMADLADMPGRFLSAGQRRRVNLCRLIVSKSPLWLLDEPTIALDAATIIRLEDLIVRHRAAGGIVVMSTHATQPITDAKTLDLAGFAA